MLQFQAIHWQLENAGIDPSSMAFIFLQNVDVLFRGEGVPLPSTVILDYVYGYCHLQSLAKQERWFQPNGGIPQQILRTDSATSTRGIDETDVTPEPDNPNDSDYAPPELDQTTSIINPRGSTTLQQGGMVWRKPWMKMNSKYISMELRQKWLLSAGRKNRAEAAARASSGSEPTDFSFLSLCFDGVEESSVRYWNVTVFMIVVCLLFRVHCLLAVSNPELRHDCRHQGSKTTQQHAYRWAKTYFNVRSPGDF